MTKHGSIIEEWRRTSAGRFRLAALSLAKLGILSLRHAEAQRGLIRGPLQPSAFGGKAT